MSSLALVIQSRERDLGGFSVRRILPYGTHRMVGPFIFFDHMGPAEFPAGRGISVRPHPHIHLATVTYLFEGQIRHRDSLGSDQIIEPGAINWMTAGRGIVHSERAPDAFLKTGGRLNGIQLWVALPTEHENCAPTFTHVPSHAIPEWKENGVQLRLLLGTSGGKKSPAPVHSDLFYVEAKIPAGARLAFQTEGRECAAYVVKGKIKIGTEHTLSDCTMGVAMPGLATLDLEAQEDSHVMLLGGTSLGKREIYWNFISSSADHIRAAAKEWENGPGSERFPKIPGDDQEFISLSTDPLPKGSIL